MGFFFPSIDVILKVAAQKSFSLFGILNLNCLNANDPSDPRFCQAFITFLLSSLGCPSWTGGSAAVQLCGMKGLWTPRWCSAPFCVLPPVSLCRSASYKSVAAVAQPEQQLHPSTTGARSKWIGDTESIIPLSVALCGQNCISAWDKCDFVL